MNKEVLSIYFKSIIDSDSAPIVICDSEHTVIYMNPSAVKRYGTDITEKSIKGCHNDRSNQKIDQIVDWFSKDTGNNIIYTSRNDKENKDVYMVALRSEKGELIGYYEKHEYRNKETRTLYEELR